jgi:hypothetical protein
MYATIRSTTTKRLFSEPPTFSEESDKTVDLVLINRTLSACKIVVCFFLVAGSIYRTEIGFVVE